MTRLSCVVAMVAAMLISTSSAAAAGPVDTIGMVDPTTGIWHMSDHEGDVASFYFGNPGDAPFTGDWDCDGVDTPGLYRQSDGFVYLRNSNTAGVADIEFFFGNPGDVPVPGDFNGNGCDTVSIYRPSEGRFFIINALGSGSAGLGAAERDFYFGDPGDQPFIGDFDGDGIDTAGLHRASTGRVYFRNSLTSGIADADFIFGDPGDRFVAGDWNGDGRDTPALFRPSTERLFYRFTNTSGFADQEGQFGGEPWWLPVAGRFGMLVPGPLQPSGVQVTTGGGSGELAVHWDTLPVATSYRVYWSYLPGDPKVDIASVSQSVNQFGMPHDSATRRSYVDGLGPRHPRNVSGGLECYRVSAVVAGAEGPMSREACFPASPFFTPAAGTGGGSGEISVTWKAPTGADHYDVLWSLLPGGSKVKVATVAESADQFGVPWSSTTRRYIDGLPPRPPRSLVVGQDCYVIAVYFAATGPATTATSEVCFTP